MKAVSIPETISIDGVLFTKKRLSEYCEEICKGSDEPDWKKELYAFIRWILDPLEEDLIQFTSGTTGDPKEVRITRKAMFLSARKTLDFLGLEDGDSALLALPLRYVAGKMMVVRALLGGLDLVLAAPSGRPLKELERKVSFAAMLPLQVYESLKNGDPLSLISKLIIGGGELNEDIRRELALMHTPECYHSFGMTETCTHFALKRINGPFPQDRFICLEGVELRLDQRGCLVVNVPGITQEPVISNDLVEIDETASGFTWLGRYDNLINSGGIKILPELLEQKARQCTALECLALSAPDPKLGERVVLMVEYGGENPPIEKWFACLRDMLPAYEVPKKIICVAEMPRNKSMKPDRTSAARMLL
jgi:O-succinylbenzoic acid--CoA ligase